MTKKGAGKKGADLTKKGADLTKSQTFASVSDKLQTVCNTIKFCQKKFVKSHQAIIYIQISDF